MLTVQARNVNHALYHGTNLIVTYGNYVSSRGLDTIEACEPVTTTYDRPCERVLFLKLRDANPFFHFMEGLWIIAQRNDVGFLAQFNKRMMEYSDNGHTLHGAYGWRMRNQIHRTIQLLKDKPDTRQAVLQIWDHKQDLGVASKDIPCNDLIFLKIRDGRLNMTVCNRSNDMIWGCYGANAVHFSMLQEYIAAMVGVKVGFYNQVSDSFHVYPDNPAWGKIAEHYYHNHDVDDPYKHGIQPWPMVSDPDSFDAELMQFLAVPEGYCGQFNNNLFPLVAQPMYMAWKRHKANKNGAGFAASIVADDWRLACLEWLERRGDTTDKKYWGFNNNQLFIREDAP